ncbi:mxaK protein [Methylohalomonas lacus]|uniref:MxaK protein n=1 Tax=Methylohalomonas lacus TaxID=398773 RepID=A0AAE3L4R8_9GAMM|nr:hypothetical protein [Methylohalomonas lacus]MCS3902157.1 mxaK protein [Methylohalomonas lacus]
MAGVTLKSASLWLGACSMLLLVAVIVDAVPVLNAYRINSNVERIMQSSIREPAPEDLSHEERLAYAWRLNELGEEELAVAEYRLLAGSTGVAEKIRIAAHYNLGNIYLRDALAEAEDINVDQARTRGQLAKAQLRDALRLDPEYWDARYNLELAHHIVPDLPLGEGGEDPEAVEREDVYSDMSGSPYGMP